MSMLQLGIAYRIPVQEVKYANSGEGKERMVYKNSSLRALKLYR